MATASLDTITITQKYRNRFENISSLTLSNMGNNVLYVTVNGVKRPVAPANTDFGAAIPVAPFVIESFGNGIDVNDFVVEFEGGAGSAILDVIQLHIKNCTR